MLQLLISGKERRQRLKSDGPLKIQIMITKIMSVAAYSPFKRKPHKMVNHTQTICWLLPTNCLSMFDHLVGLALKGLSLSSPILMSESFLLWDQTS